MRVFGPTATALIASVATFALVGIATAQDAAPLPSWNDGDTKQAILDFVKDATTEDGARLCGASRAHRRIRQ